MCVPCVLQRHEERWLTSLPLAASERGLQLPQPFYSYAIAIVQPLSFEGIDNNVLQVIVILASMAVPLFKVSKNQLGLRRSDPLRSSPSSRCLLVSDSVGTTSSCSLLTFPLSVSLALPRLRCLCLSVSRTHNCARLPVVATQSSRLNCRSRLSKVAWQQCRLRDIIIAHMISTDAQIYQQTWKTQSNLKTSQLRTSLVKISLGHGMEVLR